MNFHMVIHTRWGKKRIKIEIKIRL